MWNDLFTAGILHLLGFVVLGFRDIAFFSQIESLWKCCITQVYRCHRSNSTRSLRVSVPHFGNSHNISKCFIFIVFVMVICDVTAYCNSLVESRTLTLKDSKQLINVVCVLTSHAGHSRTSPPLSRPPYFLRHKNIEIRPINDPKRTSRCQVKERVPPYLTLIQKLEMIKFSEEGMPRMIG